MLTLMIDSHIIKSATIIMSCVYLQVPDDKIASSSSSSSSSTPLSSASSVTPLEKKKKAKSISFDPIVKEYSHVSSDPGINSKLSYERDIRFPTMRHFDKYRLGQACAASFKA